MREPSPPSSSHTPELAGALLLAHPSLRDDNFRHSVVLLSAHDAKGAMGVVLNRPLGKRLGQLNAEFALSPLASIPLFQGGPVDTDRVLLCAWRFHPEGTGFQLMFGIDPEKAAELQGEDGLHLRAFLGYAGWGGGQLEKELGQNAWVISPLMADVLDLQQDETLWRAILGGIDHRWKLLAGEPDDPSRN
jgi:putative transcriptional regulator